MKKAAEVLSKTRREALIELSDHLGIEFQNIVLLHEALTHTSYANEAKNKGVVHNERLEFLGDAVLELATSTYLFERFPNRPEGELTKARASIVREATLSRRAAELKLGEYLLLGHGEASVGGAAKAAAQTQESTAASRFFFTVLSFRSVRKRVAGFSDGLQAAPPNRGGLSHKRAAPKRFRGWGRLKVWPRLFR